MSKLKKEGDKQQVTDYAKHSSKISGIILWPHLASASLTSSLALERVVASTLL